MSTPRTATTAERLPEAETVTTDVAIVGAGPVGLHAALKAALLNMSAVVIDRGRRHGRAFFAPRMENIPGLPGISGAKVLQLQKENLENYRHKVHIIEDAEVVDILREDDIFLLRCARKETEVNARAVLLATGLVDRQPEIGGSIRKILPFANRGLVNYCILCDGHRVKEKKVCVIGHSAAAAGMVINLSHFEAASVTLLTHGVDLKDAGIADMLKGKPISIMKDEIMDVTGLDQDRFGVVLKSKETKYFDLCFVSLGYYHTGVDLGLRLGGHLSEDGFLVTNEDGQLLRDNGTTIENVYAVGDVRNSWNQIPIGWGDAEKAIISIFTNNA